MTPPSFPREMLLQRVPLWGRLRNALGLPWLLFCLALALRIWGLSFGLPYFFSGDEINKREAALQLAEMSFAHRNSQPSFLYNTLYLIYSVAGLLHHGITQAQYHYLGRVWMAVLGALTVVVLYRLGSVWDRWIGVGAGLLLAIVPLHTTASRYIKEDTPLALMATITILLVVRYVRDPSRPGLLLAALLTGVSFSTKYSGLVLVLPLLLGFAFSAWRTRRAPRAAVADLALTVAAFGTGFFLVSPIYLWHPDRLVSGFLDQMAYSRTGHHDGIVYDPWDDWWLYYIRTGLLPGMTWPVFVLSVAGLALMARSRDGWIVTVTTVWLYLVFEHGRAKPYPFSARYLLPLVPLLCLCAASALVKVIAVLKRKLPALVVYGLCAALFILPPLTKTLLIADEALHDTRIVSGSWMEQAIPPGSILVIAEGLPYLPASRYWGREWEVYFPEKIPELFSARRAGMPLYFVLSSFTYQRYLDHPEAAPQWTRFFRTIIDGYRLVKEFHPRWFTYGFHSPVIRIYQPPALPQTLSSDPRDTARRER